MRWRHRTPTDGRAGSGLESPSGTDAPSERDRARVRDLLERFGTNPNSFLVRYAAEWRYFFGSSVEGVVCYVRVHRTVVAWGDPLCAPLNRPAILGEFIAAMRQRRLRIGFLVLQEDTARMAMAAGCSVFNIGAEPAFDLASWRMPRGDRGKKLRWCLNHARRSGVTIEEYAPAERRERQTEREMEQVQRRWEAGLGRVVVQ